MSVKNSVKAMSYIHFDASTLTEDYQLISAGGLNEGLDSPLFKLRIINISSGPIVISYDGVNDHDYISINEIFLDLDVQTNNQPNNNVALFPKGKKVYAKYPVLPKIPAGMIYICGYTQY